jgi:hypothetical protein
MSGNGPAICPVCDEVLSERTAKCFRCDTKLEDWWPLEEVLVAGRPRSRFAWAFVAMAIGVVMGTLGPVLWWMEVVSVETPGVASVSVEKKVDVNDGALRSEPATLIQYRVQRGDSLWRVAAALTGRGSDWVELWPEYRGHEKRLMPGSVLEIPVGRVTDVR